MTNGERLAGMGEQLQRHMEGNQAVQEDNLAGNRDPARAGTETNTCVGCCHRADSTFVVRMSYDSVWWCHRHFGMFLYSLLWPTFHYSIRLNPLLHQQLAVLLRVLRTCRVSLYTALGRRGE